MVYSTTTLPKVVDALAVSAGTAGKNPLLDVTLPTFSLAYAWEKSYLAVRRMATGSERLQIRIGAAFTSSLCLLNRENVTPDILRRVHAVRERLTCIPAKFGEGNVAATAALMHDDEALSIAEEIVDIFDAIAKLYGVQKVARPSEF
ncbi:MAG: hypothetical protein H0U98_10305 [Alphaproteobacteria bacterium]|nr:hypothetical protein [Alphaproteobacteria bacterium]